MSAKTLRSCALVVVCGLASMVSFNSVMSGTIRHDRSDSLYITLAADSSFAAVGKLTGSEPGGGFLASGTLIRDQWVLTAAHVVDGSDGFGAGVNNLSFQVGGTNFQADELFVHPNWAASGGESNLFAGWDLALVRLGQAVSNVTPASLFTGIDDRVELLARQRFVSLIGRSISASTDGCVRKDARHTATQLPTRPDRFLYGAKAILRRALEE